MADARSGQSHVRRVTRNEDDGTRERDMTVENVSASVLNSTDLEMNVITKR
jgi:hypothetical protein